MQLYNQRGRQRDRSDRLAVTGLPPEGGSRRITVHVEDEPLHIWRWARVRDAVAWYSEEEYRRVRRGERRVVDAAGHPVGLEGQLQDGARLYLRDAGR